ncbi:UNVERIFIED_CONTAM: methyl-accepting chemotaxis protein [Acetivibrio alkalicellulosi]
MKNTKYLRYLLAMIILLFSILILTGFSNNVKTAPTSKDGVMDLTNWNFNDDGILKLGGEWEFYWNQLLEPSKNNDDKELSGYIDVPSYWNNFVIDGKELEGDGFATYRLKLKFNESVDERLAIQFYTISTAFKMWIDDTLVDTSGIVGKSKESMKPNYSRNISTFNVSDKKESIITIQVSNYFHCRSGLWNDFYIGTEKQILNKKYLKLAFELFTIGAALIIALYYICFYYFRRKDRSMIYLSLICFMIIARTISTGEGFISVLIPNNSFYIDTFLEYISIMPGLLFTIKFFKCLFPNEIKNIFMKLTEVTTLIYVLNIFIFPIKIFSANLVYFQVFMIIKIIIILFGVILAAARKREGAYISLGSSVIFAFAAINDILSAMDVINTPYMVNYALILVMLSLAIILAKKFSIAFEQVEVLSKKSNEDKLKIEKTLTAFKRTSMEVYSSLANLNNKLSEIVHISNQTTESMNKNAAGLDEENKSIQTSVNDLNNLVTDISSVSKKSIVMTERSLYTKDISYKESLKMQEIIQHLEITKGLANSLSTILSEMSKNSNKINKLLEIIKQISSNTKLLSLNASIEAAKAGEAGKGFLLIAAEIRKLSNQSSDFATTINDILKEVIESIHSASQKATQCADLANKDSEFSKAAYNSFLEIKDTVNNIYTDSDIILNESQKVTSIANTVLNEFKNISHLIGQTSHSIDNVTILSNHQLDYINNSKVDLENIKVQVEMLAKELIADKEGN